MISTPCRNNIPTCSKITLPSMLGLIFNPSLRAYCQTGQSNLAASWDNHSAWYGDHLVQYTHSVRNFKFQLSFY